MSIEQQLREAMREEARAEIASLCGLVLRRLQEAQGFDAASIFGEALRDFGGTQTEPGE